MRLGYTVNNLKQVLTFEEYHDWLLFNQVSPIGDSRYDILNAINCVSFGGGEVSKFIPNWKPKSEEQKLAELKALFRKKAK